MKILLVLVFCGSAIAALENDALNAKGLVEKSRENAEKRMRDALGKVQSSVLVNPLKRLKELSSAGQGDIDAIMNFKGPGNKNQAMNSSLHFWRNKMEDVIKKYVENPQIYQGLIIDFVFIPPDPTWNGSAEYRKVEKELNDLEKSALEQMKQELDKRSGKPIGSISDITEASWKKLQGQRALDDAIFSINFRKQLLKNEAANGNTSNIPEFKNHVPNVIKNFMSEVNGIYN